MLLLLACTAPADTAPKHARPEREDTSTAPDTTDDTTDTTTNTTDTTNDTSDTTADCEPGVTCISSFPFRFAGDTRDATSRAFDVYGCDDADESGAEYIFRADVPNAGFLSAAVYDDDGVDVDVHLLSSLDADACLDRGDHDAHADVDGSTYVIVDTYVSRGEEQAGPFTLDIGFLTPSVGPCDVETGAIERIGTDELLDLPATGPVVLEAHLVDVDDGYGTDADDPWPQSATEGLADHYATSQAATGIVLYRDQVWAPQEGCEYGQSAYGDKLPVEDESWYVNMYWRHRPDPGTRMILRTPDGRAVVAAAGYETGPGDLDHIAGTPEEAHFYLGTGHLDEMTVGFAVDPSLPLGPRLCE